MEKKEKKPAWKAFCGFREQFVFCRRNGFAEQHEEWFVCGKFGGRCASKTCRKAREKYFV